MVCIRLAPVPLSAPLGRGRVKVEHLLNLLNAIKHTAASCKPCLVPPCHVASRISRQSPPGAKLCTTYPLLPLLHPLFPRLPRSTGTQQDLGSHRHMAVPLSTSGFKLCEMVKVAPLPKARLLSVSYARKGFLKSMPTTTLSVFD